jgi:hypothetical protein
VGSPVPPELTMKIRRAFEPIPLRGQPYERRPEIAIIIMHLES